MCIRDSRRSVCWKRCPEVPMWVWTDELVDRVDAVRKSERQRVPLMAYAVDDEVDLEALAREMFEIKTEVNPLDLEHLSGEGLQIDFIIDRVCHQGHPLSFAFPHGVNTIH